MAEPGDEEKFALSRIFAGDEEFSVAVRAGLSGLVVLARDDSESGFVANLKFPEPLPSLLKAPGAMEWYFKHRSMPHGGSFIVTYDSPEMLILFAMSFYGPWPTFDPTAFTPITG